MCSSVQKFATFRKKSNCVFFFFLVKLWHLVWKDKKKLIYGEKRFYVLLFSNLKFDKFPLIFFCFWPFLCLRIHVSFLFIPTTSAYVTNCSECLVCFQFKNKLRCANFCTPPVHLLMIMSFVYCFWCMKITVITPLYDEKKTLHWKLELVLTVGWRLLFTALIRGIADVVQFRFLSCFFLMSQIWLNIHNVVVFFSLTSTFCLFILFNSSEFKLLLKDTKKKAHRDLKSALQDEILILVRKERCSCPHCVCGCEWW